MEKNTKKMMQNSYVSAMCLGICLHVCMCMCIVTKTGLILLLENIFAYARNIFYLP